MTALYFQALAAIAVSLSVLMAGAWVVQQRTGNSGWVDTIWTFSLGLVGAGSALWPIGGAPPNARQWLVAALVAIWSLRLGVAYRDPYRRDHRRPALCGLRQGMGRRFAREGCSSSCRTRRSDRSRWRLRSLSPRAFPATGCGSPDYLGALILLVGIAGEAMADAQLRAFRTDPANKGRVCDVGLWRWSRHPNYFFEWFGWLAYPVIGIIDG